MPIEKKPEAVIFTLVDTRIDRKQQQTSLKEAELLVQTYGGKVAEVITQNASHRKSGTYMGSGKITEISRLIEKKGYKILVINDHIKAGQLYTIKNIVSPDEECEVWDRTQLILQIFKKRATTAEAKLQIELAELKHHGPELSGIGMSMSQQAGNTGTRGGPGETHSETMRRHWQEEIKKVENRIKKATQGRHQQVKHRKKSQLPTVSIIGYTNAGKTTLFNTLGNKQDKVQNALFATLDSSVSTMYLQNVGKEIFITDTIGFIQDLPHDLIDAFKSTLYETIHADILLHVVDSADKHMEEKINTVENVVKSMNLEDKNSVLVFNKADKISDTKKTNLRKKFSKQKMIFVSAITGDNIDKLIDLIEKELIAGGLERAKHLSYLDQLPDGKAP